ncbi:hypothetical protein AQUCO_00201373v1 [Aquilegia coerulea]|uniref:ABC-2 type transporter transmembrane domain-containing protein n=1 Tax=Aquilegia coerulea TaxID=218851 RepID=A0A2G5F7N1_AQUCA|nr:hypothetical protein AQUCO_00201373v1 [Aquilegia coerulea]
MANSSQETSSFMTQANALFRKNLIFQKRNIKTNIRLVMFPIIVCSLTVILQIFVTKNLKSINKLESCGCVCINENADGNCEKTECGIQHSTLEQMPYCSIPSPPRWPALLQIPSPEFRAVRTNFTPFTDLPDESCRNSGACPATLLLTGLNQSFGISLAANLFASGLDRKSFDNLDSLSNLYLGSDTSTGTTGFLEPAFIGNSPIYNIQPQCAPNSTFFVPVQIASVTIQQEVQCLGSLHLWRQSSSMIKDEIFKGYQDGNSERKINEIVAAFDFLNSDKNNFNVSIWYNSTVKNDDEDSDNKLVRVPRLVNAVSNAYLQLMKGTDVRMLFDFVKEMPKPAKSVFSVDILSDLGALLFTWVILQLFPVILESLVYEKQQKLRIMMKMHGLGDGPYWIISYAYFFFMSFTYVLCLVVFGSAIGLKFFRMNDFSVQFVFYFVYINLQIAFAFLMATSFSNVKTVTVMGHMYVLGSGIIGAALFQKLVQDHSFPRLGLVLLEIFPCFSLYRGLYEFGYSSTTDGMLWKDLRRNGMGEVLIIMVVEWFIVLLIAYYFDQVVSIGSGVRKHPLFFLTNFQKKPSLTSSQPSLHRRGSRVSVPMEKPDVSLEREKVEQLLLEPDFSYYPIICDNLKKMYPGKDGNPDKFAVRGLSLALSRGECFGMLGPNGAGKTSSINMVRTF